ncbi:centrosomal protein of 85 kDa-like [Haliotis cracherodii]|uniref:centrosomal protein of 85 kDa-like n=1 Tax=Haliotis cracherodii TaxID=6455 RepID=UPI0039EA8DBC
MSWQGDMGLPPSHSTNVPDYQKMLQAPQYSNAGWREAPHLEDAQTLVPSPVVRHPVNSPQKLGGQHLGYHPSKYGLVAGSTLYPESQFNDGIHPSMPSERAVQYSTREGETIYRIQEAYMPDQLPVEDKLQYDEDYMEMKTPPSRSGHDLQSGYKTPPSKTSTLSEFHQLPKSGFSSQGDMRQWQTQQQQYYDQQSVYNKGVRQVGMEGVFQQLSVKDEDETQWDPVRRAADSIIKEKNMIIHKLKSKISMMEEDLSICENKLRSAIISKEDRDDVLHLKIQELQHKNSAMRTDIIDSKSQKNAEIDEMEIKLGAAEHEVMQLKTVLRNKEVHVREAQTKLVDAQREVEEWRSKFQEMKSNHQSMKANLDSLERYLADLPTVEEKAQMAKELVALREERAVNRATLEDLEKKLMQTKQTLSSREMDLREMSEREHQMLERLNEATDNVERLRSEGSGAALYKAEVEAQGMREEKERLAIDLEKAKKLLETTVRRLRHLEAKHQSEARQMSERVSQEEEMVIALRGEVATKDSQVEDLRKAMKELGSTNQDLMEHNLIMQEQLKHLELQCTDETLKRQRRLMRELGFCFSELQSLVQVCMQRAHGEDPNISMLLGTKGMSSGYSDDGPSNSEDETIVQWQTKVTELRGEVDQLRSIICNKYAEDQGGNMECNPQ